MELTLNFFIGIIGAIILVTGAAWPEKAIKHPAKSSKNWLFLIGGLFMLAYSILNYLNGGSIFFVILQAYINTSSIFMMTNIKDSIDGPLMALLGAILVGLSLYLFEGIQTAIFVGGLSFLGVGFVLANNTVKRNSALTVGSIFISYFSFLEKDWIFFGLNAFFALFSAYYAWKLFNDSKKKLQTT